METLDDYHPGCDGRGARRLMTPADLLALAGRALYGDRWLMRFARDLNISDDTVSRWMSGRVKLRDDHGVLRDAAKILRLRAADLVRTAKAIEGRKD